MATFTGLKIAPEMAKDLSKMTKCMGNWLLSARRMSVHQTIRRQVMSDKDRQKKDGQDKNKLNQARRADNFNQTRQQAKPKHQAKDESNFTDTEAGPGRSNRQIERSRTKPGRGPHLSDHKVTASSAPQAARAAASRANKGK